MYKKYQSSLNESLRYIFLEESLRYYSWLSRKICWVKKNMNWFKKLPWVHKKIKNKKY